MLMKKDHSNSALDVLENHVHELTKICFESINDLRNYFEKLGDNWESKIIEKTNFIIDINKGREALLKTIANLNNPEQSEVLKNQISSLFLTESWEYLTSDPQKNERLHLVTGLVTDDGTRILCKIEKVKYDKKSAVYVSADRIDAHEKILSFSNDFGHQLLGMFHSHIAKGSSSTRPSSIDRSFMDRHEKLGCYCVGGIFSLDGYVRFFANKPFDLNVYGKGVQKINDKSMEKLFKITAKRGRNETDDI